MRQSRRVIWDMINTVAVEPTFVRPPGGGGGGVGGRALGYFLGGYVPPGTPNWHPVLEKFSLKLTPRSRNGPIFYTPF